MNEQPYDPPSDLTAVAADDALLDALPDTPPEDSDVLTQVLAAWRRELVDSEPTNQLISVDTALAMMPRRSLLGRFWTRLVTLSRLGKH